MRWALLTLAPLLAVAGLLYLAGVAFRVLVVRGDGVRGVDEPGTVGRADTIDVERLPARSRTCAYIHCVWLPHTDTKVLR